MVKTMNFGNVMVLAIAVVAVSTILRTTEAAEYVVGDDLGWTVPPGGAASYASWAAKYRFVVNDILCNQLISYILHLFHYLFV